MHYGQCSQGASACRRDLSQACLQRSLFVCRRASSWPAIVTLLPSFAMFLRRGCGQEASNRSVRQIRHTLSFLAEFRFTATPMNKSRKLIFGLAPSDPAPNSGFNLPVSCSSLLTPTLFVILILSACRRLLDRFFFFYFGATAILDQSVRSRDYLVSLNLVWKLRSRVRKLVQPDSSFFFFGI